MKKILFLSFLLACNPISAETITARADIWCPYNCDPKSDKPGILIELLKISMEKNGDVVDYKTMPWVQAVADVSSGKFNSIIAATSADCRGILTTKIVQVASTTCGFALKTSKKIITKANDLKKFNSIAIVKDYSYGPRTDKVIFDKSMKAKVTAIEGDNTLVTNIRRLLEGKAEVILEDINVMEYQLNARKIDNIKMIGCTEDKVPLWIGFTESNPKSKKWVDLLAKTQIELEKSGEMDKIYKKYNVTRTK